MKPIITINPGQAYLQTIHKWIYYSKVALNPLVVVGVRFISIYDRACVMTTEFTREECLFTCTVCSAIALKSWEAHALVWANGVWTRSIHVTRIGLLFAFVFIWYKKKKEIKFFLKKWKDEWENRKKKEYRQRTKLSPGIALMLWKISKAQ